MSFSLPPIFSYLVMIQKISLIYDMSISAQGNANYVNILPDPLRKSTITTTQIKTNNGEVVGENELRHFSRNVN